MSELNIINESPVVEVTTVDYSLVLEQIDMELAISESHMSLDVVEERPTLDITEINPVVEVSPPSVTLNQYYSEGSTAFTAVAGKILGGQRAVYVANNEAFYADPADLNIPGQTVGVTTHAANAGSPIQIQYAGLMEDPGWEFTPGPVYIGTAGALVQTRPLTGWVLNIGVALSPTKLLINKSMSIEVL